jgi:hypothetical protein
MSTVSEIVNNYPYVAISSIQDINDKIAVDSAAQGETAITVEDNFAEFKSVSLDNFNFPISEIESQIKLRTSGANRFASSAVVANGDYILNSDFTLTSDYLTRNVTTAATLELITEAAQARNIRRIQLHAENANPANDESLSIQIQRSYDGTNYEPTENVESGIIDKGGGVYDFDYILKVAKAVKILVTVSGASSGNWRIFGATVEFLDLEDQLPQNSREKISQLGNNLLFGDQYSFRMPSELRGFMVVDDTKEDYTASEIIAESDAVGSVVEIVYSSDDPNTKNIEKNIVQTDTKKKEVKTFGNG